MQDDGYTPPFSSYPILKAYIMLLSYDCDGRFNIIITMSAKTAKGATKLTVNNLPVFSRRNAIELADLHREAIP
jgi:hypothetical protein